MAITLPNAYYKFNESSGNAADSTSGGNTLTNNGSATYNSGILSNCVDLTTTGKYMDCADNSAFDATTSLSISGWIYLNASPGSSEWAIASSADSTGSNRNFVFEFGVQPNGFYAIVSKDGTVNSGSYDEFDSAASILPATGGWHHYAIVYDVSAGTMLLYIDNVSKTITRRAAQNVTSLSTVSSRFSIGSAYGTSRTGNWKFDEFGFWKNYKLTASEIYSLYNGGTPPSYEYFQLSIPYFGNSLVDHDQVSGTVSYSNDGDLLVVSVNSTSNDVSAMTYNGTSMTQLGTAQYFSTYARYHSTWYLVNPSVGTYNIVTTGGANWQFDIFSVKNVDQTTPISGATTTNTSGANAYVDVTTTVNNAYAIGVGQIAATSTAGTDTTMLVNGTAGNFYTLRSTSPVATAGTFRVQSAHAGSVGYFLRGFGINPVATITANSGFFALM